MVVWLSLGPAGTQTSVDRNDVVWACWSEVLPEYWELAEYQDVARDISRGMRKDCGIHGPQAAGTIGCLGAVSTATTVISDDPRLGLFTEVRGK